MSVRVSATSSRTLAMAACIVAAIAGPTRSVAQTNDCRFPVDWRELYKSEAYLNQLDSNCFEGDDVRTTDASGLKSAQLSCVARLYALAWGVPKFTDVFEKDDDRPMLVYSVVQETGLSVLAPGLDQADLKKWVIRQSPHHDRNIRVCAGARVWLEVASRPRLPMKKITTEDLNRTDDAGGLLELDDGDFEGTIKKLGMPADVQYPPDGAVLEPWQEVVVGAKPPHVVGPPPEPIEKSILVPTASAGAGAALAYLLMRAARSSSNPVPSPGVPLPIMEAPRPRIRIRAKQG